MFSSTSFLPKPTIQDVLDAMPVLERFVVLIYDRTSQYQRVNDVRKVLFAQKRKLRKFPTAEALLQNNVSRESVIPRLTLLGAVIGS